MIEEISLYKMVSLLGVCSRVLYLDHVVELFLEI